MVYNGYDTDFVRPSSAPGAPWPCVDGAAPTYDCPPPASGIDWLAKMWYDELAQSWGTASPARSAPSALAVGQTVDPARLDAPSGLRCVAARKLSFSFHKLRKHIRRADVYVNGRHVLRAGRLQMTHLTVKAAQEGGYTSDHPHHSAWLSPYHAPSLPGMPSLTRMGVDSLMSLLASAALDISPTPAPAWRVSR
jgi:hypothetical protein